MTELDDLLQKARNGEDVLGGVISPISTETKVVAPSAGVSPDSFSLKAFGRVPVLVQQGGTCVGNSIAAQLMYMHYERTGEILPFKGEIFNEQIVHNVGGAAAQQDIYKEIIAHGAISESGLKIDFPQSFASVDPKDPATIKSVISQGHSLSAATWLNTGFWDQSNNHNPNYVAASPGQANMAYHALCVVGYTNLGVIIQNSWGSWYNVNGFNYLSWDYVANHIDQLYLLTDDESLLLNTYIPPTENNRAVSKGTSPAVYLVKDTGRIWIQNPQEAYRMGVNLANVEHLSPEDIVWELPVIGQDAPLSAQG